MGIRLISSLSFVSFVPRIVLISWVFTDDGREVKRRKKRGKRKAFLDRRLHGKNLGWRDELWALERLWGDSPA